MIFVLDNYDSFTYNLVQYIGTLEPSVEVARNDEITVAEIEKLNPQGIIISPGPKTPKEAGISKELIQHFSGKIPVLGVCLGHQAIGEVFGGEIVRAQKIMHGKTSMILNNQEDLFVGLPKEFVATRYHSLVVKRETLPSQLLITAETEDKVIMGLKVKEHPQTLGVQFHPESILTEVGMRMIENYYKLCKT